jgi:hypothetical protein
MYFYNTIFTALAAFTVGSIPYRVNIIQPDPRALDNSLDVREVFAKSVCYAVSSGINWQYHNIIPQNLINSFGLKVIEKAKELVLSGEVDNRISELVKILSKTSSTDYYLSSNLIYKSLSIIGTGTIFVFEYGINNLVHDINLTALKYIIVRDLRRNEQQNKIIENIKTSTFYQYSLDKTDSTNKAEQFINDIVNSENGSTQNLECIRNHIKQNFYFHNFGDSYFTVAAAAGAGAGAAGAGAAAAAAGAGAGAGAGGAVGAVGAVAATIGAIGAVGGAGAAAYGDGAIRAVAAAIGAAAAAGGGAVVGAVVAVAAGAVGAGAVGAGAVAAYGDGAIRAVAAAIGAAAAADDAVVVAVAVAAVAAVAAGAVGAPAVVGAVVAVAAAAVVGGVVHAADDAAADIVAIGAIGAVGAGAAIGYVSYNLAFDNMITECIEYSVNDIQFSGETQHTQDLV